MPAPGERPAPAPMPAPHERTAPHRTAAPKEPPAPPERRTSSVELFWDLVFAFAVTQVAILLSHHLSWAGFGRAILVLALVWWAWSAFVWAANAQEDGSASLLFALTYAAVRFMHLALYADASRRGNAAWSAIAGFAVTVAIGMALLIAGSFADGWLRVGLWAAAAAIDYAGPAWLTRERL